MTDTACDPLQPGGDPGRPMPTHEGGWHALPPRARLLFLLGATPSYALLAALLGFVLGQIALGRPLAGAGIGLVLGMLAGAWIGAKQFRHVQWALDDSGLALRRGRLWQRETRVPATRVQHLDIKRGPWQRRRTLATLIVHTAGTRHGALTVPHLDEADAQRLRERLSQRIDDET